jgi:transcriptional regulator with XRE-family HTH domain
MSKPSLLGPKLEAARKKKKFSQIALAEMIGVTRASISLYETGKGNPSYKMLGRLAEVLAIPFAELAGLGDGGDDYTGAMITQHIFNSVNEDRGAFIKQHLGLDETYVEVEFMRNPVAMSDFAIASPPPGESEKHVQWPSISVFAIPSVSYISAKMYIVPDNKMGVRYPEGSRHIMHPILNKSNWQYLTGLHAISIEGNATLIRRITSNKNGSMTLADAAGNEMSVMSDSIAMIWRVGQTVHMPSDE